MSHTIYKKGNLLVTSFAGKQEGYQCRARIQITNGPEPFEKLSLGDVYRLVQALSEWLKEHSEISAKQLAEDIEKMKELQGTIFEEGVKCSRFIDGLELLEIPLRLLGTKIPDKEEA